MQKTSGNTEEEKSLVTMEYRMVREALENRVALKSRLLQLNITLLAGIITFGLQFRNPIIVLLYPSVTLWISIIWASSTYEIRQMSCYLLHAFEPRGLTWERVRNSTMGATEELYQNIMKALFLVSDLIALGLGIAMRPENIFLIIFAAVNTLLTLLFFFVADHLSKRDEK